MNGEYVRDNNPTGMNNASSEPSMALQSTTKKPSHRKACYSWSKHIIMQSYENIVHFNSSNITAKSKLNETKHTEAINSWFGIGVKMWQGYKSYPICNLATVEKNTPNQTHEKYCSKRSWSLVNTEMTKLIISD